MERQTITGSLSTSGRLSGALSVGGGTTDYNELENKPTYNGHVIEGDMTNESLGIWQPKNFSTEEQDTGILWVDGSHIYRKTYLLNTLTAGQDNIIPLNISNFKTLIKVFGTAKMQAMPNMSIPFISSNLSAYIINPYNIDENTSLHIETGTIYRDGNVLSDVTITILYTKTED